MIWLNFNPPSRRYIALVREENVWWSDHNEAFPSRNSKAELI